MREADDRVSVATLENVKTAEADATASMRGGDDPHRAEVLADPKVIEFLPFLLVHREAAPRAGK